MLTILRNLIFHNWFRLRRSMTLGVRILVFDPQGQVCLVRHTYVAGWHLPGGGVERGEDARTAACKEVFEEAGLIVAPEQMRLVSIHTNFQSFPGDHVLVYRAENWQRACPDGVTNTAHEIAACGFFPCDALPEGTTPATRRRLAEAAGTGPASPIW